MDQTSWIVVVVVALVALAVGFLFGRMLGGARQRVVDLELELDRQKTELADYKQEVEAHFDKTASLFVSMAGSYKDLFDHLSSGSERISAGPARKRFRERVDALLLGDEGAGPKLSAAAGAMAGAAAVEPDDAADADADASTPRVGEVTWGPEAEAVPSSAPAAEPRVRDSVAPESSDAADSGETARDDETPADDDTRSAPAPADDADTPTATRHKAD